MWAKPGRRQAGTTPSRGDAKPGRRQAGATRVRNLPKKSPARMAGLGQAQVEIYWLVPLVVLFEPAVPAVPDDGVFMSLFVPFILLGGMLEPMPVPVPSRLAKV